MVARGLRELLERGDGVGLLHGDDVVTGAAEHPVCGDRVQLSLRIRDGIVQELRWQATGCPASMAVAALCAKALVDVPVAEVEAALRAGIAQHGGLARHEQHAEAMVLRAVHAVLGE